MALRIGSRGSALARWQAAEVQRRLGEQGIAAEIHWVETSGDRATQGRLAAIGGKGLFTQELESGLREGQLDVAVHSLKDVPTQPAEGLILAALLEREDPRDVLIAAAGATLATLPSGARLGTSSLRRQAQLLALRPDLAVCPLRGNVDTRLRKWREGACAALLLASAGLHRLGLQSNISEYLDPERFCPAAGQGILALQCRADDELVHAQVRRLHHVPTALAAVAERSLLAALQCGCDSPVGALAALHGGRLSLQCVVAAPDGRQSIRASIAAQPGESPETLGWRAAETLLQQGAAALLHAEVR